MVEESKVASAQIDLKGGKKFTFEDADGQKYITDNPKKTDFKEFLLVNDIDVEEVKMDDNAFISIFAPFIQMGLYIGLVMWMMRRMMPGQKQEEIVERVPDITFDDIAGQKELKSDLKFVIEYLKNPKKYSEIGARMPKGIVLYGPPGTGKTLTAKAIAGTAGVPFFSVSGSDFIEMYVGLGARRVRNLFKKAREKAPCIIFIDEIDAVGGHRGVGGNSEKDQTINALLNELDGFNGREGILTICATNRLEDLDQALIRPGRFDKQLAVPLPEKEDRVDILKVHTRGKKLADDIDFNEISSMTVGFSGAALESMVNEAAFIAVNEGFDSVNMNHIEKAFYKMVMKGDKKENQSNRDKEELRIVAYHEAGHAIATKLYTNDAVSKVTIVSFTSGAGGATFRTPQEMGLYSKSYIRSLIKVMYAGRAAEHLLLKNDDEITTGASNDIKQATALIKEYISIYGMNDKIGLINTKDLLRNQEPSILLEEASKLSIKLYDEVKSDLEKNFAMLEETAETLLANESISEKELDDIINKHKEVEEAVKQ
jgi:cell division protease FtsH